MEPTHQSGSLVRFGQFELDSCSGELRKGGVRIRVPDQALQVLSSLLARPGEVVTREELVAVLWPDGTHVDYENGLNAAVKKLRIALCDSGGSPRFIETLPRRGYRFIAPVNPSGTVRPSPEPDHPSLASPPRNFRIIKITVLAALAVTIGAMIVPFAGRNSDDSRRLAESNWGRPSGNPEANGYFSKSQLFLGVGTFDLGRSRQMLQRALELDPAFGKARAEYGFTHLLMVNAGYSNDSAWYYKAEEEIRHGLRDDPGFCHGHAALAALHLHRGRKELAPPESKEALRLNPADVDAAHWLAVYHWYSGDTATAQKLEQANLARTPRFFPARLTLGALACEQGDWNRGIREYESLLEYDPRHGNALRLLTRAYMDLGDLAKARETWTRFRPEDRQSYSTRAIEAILLALEGKREAAARTMDSEVLKYLDLNALSTLTGAEFHAVMGNRQQGLEWLERAVRRGDDRAEWFVRDPALKAIRDEPRFKQIVHSAATRRLHPKD